MKNFYDSEYQLAAGEIRDAAEVYNFELAQVLPDNSVVGAASSAATITNALSFFDPKGVCIETEEDGWVIAVPCFDENCVPAANFIPLLGEFFLAKVQSTDSRILEAVKALSLAKTPFRGADVVEAMKWLAGSLYALRYDSDSNACAFAFCTQHLGDKEAGRGSPLESFLGFYLWKDREGLRRQVWQRPLEKAIAESLLAFAQRVQSFLSQQPKESYERSEATNRVH